MLLLRLGVLVLAVGLAACEKKAAEETTAIASDKSLVEEASAAAAPVIQNASDCPAAKAALADANSKIAEAEGKVRTAVGRNLIASVKAQVKAVAEACP